MLSATGEAASAASVTSDAVLAVVEARMRRQAQHAKTLAQVHEEEMAF